MNYSCQEEADHYEGHPEPEQEMPAHPIPERDEVIDADTLMNIVHDKPANSF